MKARVLSASAAILLLALTGCGSSDNDSSKSSSSSSSASASDGSGVIAGEGSAEALDSSSPSDSETPMWSTSKSLKGEYDSSNGSPVEKPKVTVNFNADLPSSIQQDLKNMGFHGKENIIEVRYPKSSSSDVKPLTVILDGLRFDNISYWMNSVMDNSSNPDKAVQAKYQSDSYEQAVDNGDGTMSRYFASSQYDIPESIEGLDFGESSSSTSDDGGDQTPLSGATLDITSDTENGVSPEPAS